MEAIARAPLAGWWHNFVAFNHSSAQLRRLDLPASTTAFLFNARSLAGAPTTPCQRAIELNKRHCRTYYSCAITMSQWNLMADGDLCCRQSLGPARRAETEPSATPTMSRPRDASCLLDTSPATIANPVHLKGFDAANQLDCEADEAGPNIFRLQHVLVLLYFM